MGLSAPTALARDHDLSYLDCGEASLDKWLRSRAQANHAAGASRVFVLCDGLTVRAYYALAAGSLALAAAPGRLRRNMPDPIPMIVLGRLAVDRSLQGRGIGRALLHDAAIRVLQAGEAVGIRGILVDAISENARRFYLANGFSASPLDAMKLMVTMADLIATTPAPPTNPAPPPSPRPSSGPS